MNEELIKYNNGVISLATSLGSSLVAKIKAENLLPEKPSDNNTLFENVYDAKIQDFINRSIGIAKKKDDNQ